MTEAVIYFLVGFVACFTLDRIMLWRFKKDYLQVADLKKALITNHFDHVIEIGRLRDDIHKLRNFLTAQASEASKKVDWEPDNYKDLSDGVPVDLRTKFKKHNYKRFDQDELDELQQLNSKQLKQIGG